MIITELYEKYNLTINFDHSILHLIAILFPRLEIKRLSRRVEMRGTSFGLSRLGAQYVLVPAIHGIDILTDKD